MSGQEEREKKALDEWVASISEEPGAPRAAADRERAAEQPVMAAFEEEKPEKDIKPKLYTPRQLQNEMKKKTEIGKQLLEEVVKWHERRGAKK